MKEREGERNKRVCERERRDREGGREGGRERKKKEMRMTISPRKQTSATNELETEENTQDRMKRVREKKIK